MNKQSILDAAVILALSLGYRGVFKRHLAKKLDIGMGTVNYHWGTMEELRAAIVREALDKGVKQIVAQAVALRDPLMSRERLSRGQREKLDALNIAA